MKYNLEYLPIAEKDIRGAAMYIALELQAPVAAVKLVRLIRKRTDDLRDMPYMYHEYHGEPQTETTYRLMPVKNYAVFYTVREESKTIQIHRVLYARMDFDALLR